MKNAGTESGSGIVGFQSDGAGGKTNGYRKFAPSSKFNMLDDINREEDEKKEDDPDPPFLTPEEQAAALAQTQAEIEQQTVVLDNEQPLDDGASSAPPAPPAAAEENLPPPPPPSGDVVPIDLTDDNARKEILEALDSPATASTLPTFPARIHPGRRIPSGRGKNRQSLLTPRNQRRKR